MFLATLFVKEVDGAIKYKYYARRFFKEAHKDGINIVIDNGANEDLEDSKLVTIDKKGPK